MFISLKIVRFLQNSLTHFCHTYLHFLHLVFLFSPDYTFSSYKCLHIFILFHTFFVPCVKSFLHLFHYFYWYLIHLRNLFYIKIGLNIDLLLSGLNTCPIIWYRRIKPHVFWLVLNAILIVSSTLDTLTFHLCLNFLLCSIHLSTLAHLHCILVFEAT